MDVKEYIHRKNFEYKDIDSANGVQLNLKTCPFCHKSDYHFYISVDTGQFKCHHGQCGVAGSLFTLKKHLGDLTEPTSFSDLIEKEEKPIFPDDKVDEIKRAHLDLLQDKETLLYLSSRTFTLDAVKYFQLGLSHEDGINWLLFPYWDLSGLKNVKLRSLPPAKKIFKRWIGGSSPLYNERVLHEKLESILITEGETDCIALWSKGIKNVIGVSVGAGSIKPEWIKLLDKFSTIYFIYDNDDAGQMGAQRFATRLGIERCRQIKLPPDIKDINEFFAKGKTAEDFRKLLGQAEKFDVENVQSLGNVIRQQIKSLYVGTKENRLELPWKNVNKLLDGLVPGDLIVVAGRPGVGKSTVSFNILYDQAIKGIPCLLFSLEMPLWRLLPRIIALHKHIDSKLCNDFLILNEAYKELKDVPLYFAYKYDRPNWNFLADTVRSAVRYYGIQLLVFDNLHFLCRSLSKQTEEVSVMIQNFKLLAEELAIPIIVVARPRKTLAKVISGEDLKDSSDIEGDSDIILIIHRERKKSMSGEEVEGNFEAKTLIIVDKCRYSKGGSTFLLANDDEARFDELS